MPGAASLQIGGAHLLEPVLQVVVIGDSRDPAVFDLEKRAARQTVGLAVGRWQPDVGFEVLTQDQVLGSGARAVLGRAIREIRDEFVVTLPHPAEELTEGRFTNLPGALIDVVDHVVGQELQQKLVASGVERSVIVIEEADRFR